MYVEMEEKCGEMEFSLYMGYGYALVEGVTIFKCLGPPLEQTDNYWPAIIRKIMCAGTVWEKLGNMLRREGEDHRAEEMFYRAVAQVVLLFGLETWELLAAKDRQV